MIWNHEQPVLHWSPTACVKAAVGGVVEYVESVVLVLGGGRACVVNLQVTVSLGSDPVFRVTRILEVLATSIKFDWWSSCQMTV